MKRAYGVKRTASSDVELAADELLLLGHILELELARRPRVRCVIARPPRPRRHRRPQQRA